MKQSKRKTIPHFVNMDLKSSILVKNSLTWYGSFSITDIKVKVDGFGIRIGKTENGDFFMETSSSGIITNGEAFVNFAIENNKDLERATHYKNLFIELQDSAIVENIQNGEKLIFECLYKPMWVKETRDTFTQVKYEYCKHKFPSLINLFLISYLDSDGFLQSRFRTTNLVKQLESINDSRFKIFDTVVSETMLVYAQSGISMDELKAKILNNVEIYHAEIEFPIPIIEGIVFKLGGRPCKIIKGL